MIYWTLIALGISLTAVFATFAVFMGFVIWQFWFEIKRADLDAGLNPRNRPVD